MEHRSIPRCGAARMHLSGKSREGLAPEERFEQLDIEVSPREPATAEYRLKRVNVPFWPSWTKFNFGELEARGDADGQRVWFVERKSGKVVRSVDRQTGKTTGPDDPPPEWATPEGGERLDAQGN